MIYDPELLGPIHSEKFQTRDELSLESYIWEAAHPQGIVIAVHGIRSHIRFEYLSHNWHQRTTTSQPQRCLMYQGSWIDRLNKDGFTFCGVDHRGHGQSQSWNNSRCNVEFFDELTNDILDFAMSIDKRFNHNRATPLPIFILGISMGGAVVIRVAQLLRYIRIYKSRPNVCSDVAFLDQKRTSIKSSIVMTDDEIRQFEALPIRGFIAMCPAISLEALSKKWINRILLPMSGPIAKLFPYARVGQVEPNRMCPWIEDDIALDDSPSGFCKFNIPARIAHQMILVGSRVFRDAPLFYDQGDDKENGDDNANGGDKENCGEKNPNPFGVLLIHSKSDTMVDCGGAERLHEQLKPNMKDVKLWLLDKMWHFLTQEPGNEDLRERVCDWLKGRLTQDGTNAKL